MLESIISLVVCATVKTEVDIVRVEMLKNGRRVMSYDAGADCSRCLRADAELRSTLFEMSCRVTSAETSSASLLPPTNLTLCAAVFWNTTLVSLTMGV
jgi:hypothetical protein